MDVQFVGIEGLNVESYLTAGIVGIVHLRDDLVVDAERKRGTFGVHAQSVNHVKIVDVGIRAFLQDDNPTAGAFQDSPGLRTL